MAEEMQKTEVVRRKRFWIARKFQNRVMGRFVAVVVLSIVCSHLVTLGYLKLQELSKPDAQNLIYFANNLNESLAFTRLMDVLWLPMLVSALLGTGMVLILGLFYSHRLAGPLFNLKRMMRLVEAGHLDVLMKIRKHDEFHDVEEGFNRMLEGLRRKIEALAQGILALPAAEQEKFKSALQALQLDRPQGDRKK